MQILRKLLETYKYGNIEATEFIDFFKNETKDLTLDFDIDTYFKQWLFGAGHPKYDCQSIRTITAGSVDSPESLLYDVHLILTQTQNAENVADVFKVPVYVTFIKNNKIVHLERVVNDKRVQEYDFTNIPDFDKCKIDSLRLLCQNTNVVVTDIYNPNQIDYRIFPNPAINQNFVHIPKLENTNESNSINSKLPELFNCLGIAENVEIIELDDIYIIDISNLLQGVYFVRLGNHYEKFTLIK